MASTQFESLDARRAFPCWDEPARKAKFGVTLTVPVELVAFSNMPELRSRQLPGGKQKEIVFMDSPKVRGREREREKRERDRQYVNTGL